MTDPTTRPSASPEAPCGAWPERLAGSLARTLKALLLDCGLAADASPEEADRIIDAIGRGRGSGEEPPRAGAGRRGG